MRDNTPVEGVVELFSSGNIIVDNDGLVSLNDVYRIAVERGIDGGKRRPNQYFRKTNVLKSGTSGNVSDLAGEGWEFVEFIAKKHGKPISDIYKTKRGKGGGSFAHWKIALAYAQYLSHELHSHIHENFLHLNFLNNVNVFNSCHSAEFTSKFFKLDQFIIRTIGQTKKPLTFITIFRKR